ncbi:hypothetical protein D3C85_1283730 [compost metagenome]
MQVNLKMTEAEYEKVFGGVEDAYSALQKSFSVKINGVPFSLQVLSFSKDRSYHWNTQAVEMECILSPLKSKEEIAAEESVKKAEEALKAAKEVLNKVKDK